MRFAIGNDTGARLKKELATAQRLGNLRLFKIVKALLLVTDNDKIPVVAKVLNVGQRTVYDWMSHFMLNGFSWLLQHHYKGRGRKSKLTKEQKQDLYDIIVKGPEFYGFDCGIWNSAMILEVVMQEFGVSFNPRYLCSLLKKMGLSYQKAAFEAARSDDNENARKEWADVTWPKILQEAKAKGAVIIFVDEVSFAQWGSLARTWAPKGQQPRVKTCGKRKGLKMLGAIEFFKGQFQYKEAPEKFNGDSYLEFLLQVLDSYSVPVILIEDGASYHRSAPVNQFKDQMSEAGRMFTYRLPAYSPEYNPIEKLWRNTKADATHCKYFKTFEDLRAAVVRAFTTYMNEVTKVICVMNKLRMNAGVA